MNNHLVVLNEFKSVIGNKYVLTHMAKTTIHKRMEIRSWRRNSCSKPANLLQLWKLVEICVTNDFIIIMQAANTGLTGGSTLMEMIMIDQ